MRMAKHDNVFFFLFLFLFLHHLRMPTSSVHDSRDDGIWQLRHGSYSVPVDHKKHRKVVAGKRGHQLWAPYN